MCSVMLCCRLHKPSNIPVNAQLYRVLHKKTKLVPKYWFRSIITDKLYHVTHTTMKIILQLRNVSVVEVLNRLTPFCWYQLVSFTVCIYYETNIKFKLKIVRHYHSILTIPSCSHQLVQHCPNLIVGGHFNKFLDNLTNNINVHVLQTQKLSNPIKRSCVRMRERANRARHFGTVRPVYTSKWATEHRLYGKR